MYGDTMIMQDHWLRPGAAHANGLKTPDIVMSGREIGDEPLISASDGY